MNRRRLAILGALALGAALGLAGAVAAPGHGGVVVPRPRLPSRTPVLAFTCVNVKRGSKAGSVHDTSLFPFYAAAAFGAQDQLSVSGLVASDASASNARALLQFVPATGAIPTGSTIVSAQVVLHPTNPNKTGTLAVYRLTAPWDEATATPQTFPLSGHYATPAIREVPYAGTAQMSFDVTQQAIDWFSDATPNDGLLLADVSSQGGGFFTVGSSESAQKPYLRVCYVPSPCAGAPDGKACNDPQRCVAAGTCQAGVCKGGQPAVAGTVCRAAFGPCDTPEVCDGATAKCPSAAIAPASTVCRAAAGGCDVAEQCNGAAVQCPKDGLAAAGLVCRASVDVCDASETCSGTSAQCPADTFQSSRLTCRAAAGACDLAEHCSGTSPHCGADVLAAAGHPCRPAAGACDIAEACSGTNAQCPADAVKAAHAVCKPGSGTCDPDDTCDGHSASCAPVYVPDGTSCGGTNTCRDGACKSCGHEHEPCCPNKTCVGTGTLPSLTCDPGTSTCVKCGGDGQLCCGGNSGCVHSCVSEPHCCTQNCNYKCEASPPMCN